jgi:biotin transport system substrate-specific component
MSYPFDATLAAKLWPAARGARLARNIALAFGGALALVVSAKIQVPFYPVPMTLQTLVVLVLGATFGARLAAATVALYLAEGLLGLPVFAGAAAGPLYMAGPTGGFLAGFLVAAALVGFLVERGWDRSFGGLLAAMTLGHIVVFALGFGWLALMIGPAKALALGVAPFVLATIVKTVLAAALVRAVSGAVSSRKP